MCKMCQRRFYAALIICLFALESATASCLEYGHSCWGAHGKRSSGGAAAFVDGRSFQSVNDLPNSEPKLIKNQIDGMEESRMGPTSDKTRFYENLPDIDHERATVGDNGRVVESDKQSSLRNALHKRHSKLISGNLLDSDDADIPRLEANPLESVEWHQTRATSKMANHGQQLNSQPPTWESQRSYQRQQLKRRQPSLINRKDTNEFYFDYEP